MLRLSSVKEEPTKEHDRSICGNNEIPEHEHRAVPEHKQPALTLNTASVDNRNPSPIFSDTYHKITRS